MPLALADPALVLRPVQLQAALPWSQESHLPHCHCLAPQQVQHYRRERPVEYSRPLQPLELHLERRNLAWTHQVALKTWQCPVH